MVAGLALASGACSFGGSDAAKATTTTTTVAVSKPGGKGTKKAEVAAYCKAYAPVAAKASLTDRKTTAATVALVKPVVSAAPTAIKKDAQYVYDALTKLAAAPDDKTFGDQKAVVLRAKEMRKAYVRLSYFNAKNCA